MFLSLLPSILAAATALLSIFSPQVSAVVAAHPQVSVILASVYAILSHFLPSPAVLTVAPVAKEAPKP